MQSLNIKELVLSYRLHKLGTPKVLWTDVVDPLLDLHFAKKTQVHFLGAMSSENLSFTEGKTAPAKCWAVTDRVMLACSILISLSHSTGVHLGIIN